jgi:hypothetical protein
MADKDESDLVMVSNESETDSNPRKRQGTIQWQVESFFKVYTVPRVTVLAVDKKCQ